jgi:cysteine desulfurase family protein (TIGR01976 family)
MDLSFVRSSFPALASGAVLFDNPGGTQVARPVVDRTVDYLVNTNANHGGLFPTSQASDAIIDEARRAAADFLNAARPEEIVFGPNMTTLTMALSRSLAREFGPQDEIVVTRLDHDANISPWLLVAQDRGCTVRWLDFDVEDCTLNLQQLDALLNERTRMVAVGYASNAVGTVNPVHYIVEKAHEAGALTFIDAVQYAPHGPIDVQALGCDFLAVSAYKFFGPHLGALYGKYEHLDRLFPYRVRPAPSDPPGKFETGTQDHEGIAGLLGALEYLQQLGQRSWDDADSELRLTFKGRRLDLKVAMHDICAYERGLSLYLIETLSTIPGVMIYGITDPAHVDHRVPTVSIRVEGHSPQRLAAELGRRGIYVWDGNFYALAVTERLGIEERGGLLRIGLCHYNTTAEIDRLSEALVEIIGS